MRHGSLSLSEHILASYLQKPGSQSGRPRHVSWTQTETRLVSPRRQVLASLFSFLPPPSLHLSDRDADTIWACLGSCNLIGWYRSSSLLKHRRRTARSTKACCVWRPTHTILPCSRIDFCHVFVDLCSSDRKRCVNRSRIWFEYGPTWSCSTWIHAVN